MSASLNAVKPLPTSTSPDALEALAPPPLLLPGESLENYHILRQAIFAEMAPKSAVEWLLTIDVVELSWEIQRYRQLRHKLLETSRQRAIACALSRIDLIGISTDCQEDARRQTELNAFAWRSDAKAAVEIEHRLDSYGLDALALNSEVHIQVRDLYLMFEGMIVSAQHRRTMLIREFNNQHDPIRPYLRRMPRLLGQPHLPCML
jgi:hypothetical protein